MPFQELRAFFRSLEGTWLWPGLVEVAEFLTTHLISGMVPAFFIAGAIAVFLDKQRITRLMGPQANPWIAYPVAAFAGAILTVCSCGVIPIFTGIMQQGAGVGPAFTFLFASPAINLIALTWTFSLLGPGFGIGRVVCVIVCAIGIGLLMRLTCETAQERTVSAVTIAPPDEDRTDLQTFFFFTMMVIIMLTATGIFDPWIQSDVRPRHSPILSSYTITALEFLLTKLLALGTETCLLLFMLWRWFKWDETMQWLRKSWQLFVLIFPKILLGIFLSGVLVTLVPLSRYMSLFDANTLPANSLASIIGSLMYFGTIVGVNITATLLRFGMHVGPAMALLLSGPAVSLPSILALTPIVGWKRAMWYLTFVAICTSLSGWVFGMLI